MEDQAALRPRGTGDRRSADGLAEVAARTTLDDVEVARSRGVEPGVGPVVDDLGVPGAGHVAGAEAAVGVACDSGNAQEGDSDEDQEGGNAESCGQAGSHLAAPLGGGSGSKTRPRRGGKREAPGLGIDGPGPSG